LILTLFLTTIPYLFPREKPAATQFPLKQSRMVSGGIGVLKGI
jgi:hypothetical protein